VLAQYIAFSIYCKDERQLHEIKDSESGLCSKQSLSIIAEPPNSRIGVKIARRIRNRAAIARNFPVIRDTARKEFRMLEIRQKVNFCIYSKSGGRQCTFNPLDDDNKHQ
jgi:hypothetical protein